MRRKLVVAACWVLFFAAGWMSASKAQSRMSPAEVWRTMPYAERFAYVSGFFSGYAWGLIDEMNDVSAQVAAGKRTPEQKEILKFMYSVRRHKPDAASWAEVIDAVSTFYSDYRNLPVCSDNAVRFATSAMLGNAAIEQELQRVRKADAQGCPK